MSTRVVQLIASLGASGTTRGQWLHGHCPFAPWLHSSGKDRHPSFGMRVDTGSFKCFSCGSKGSSFFELVMQIRRLEKSIPKGQVNLKRAMKLAEALEDNDVVIEIGPWQEEPKTTVKGLNTFPESWLNTFVSVERNAEALAYLSNRDVSRKTYSELDLRYDTSRHRVCFPVRTWEGVLAGLVGRDTTGASDLPYLSYGYQDKRNPDIWMNENRVDLSAPIILCEGPFDLASVYRVYPNVLAGCTAKVSYPKLHRIRDASIVVTFYDSDAAGDKGRQQIEDFFKGEQTYVSHLVPYGDEDAGSMDAASIRDGLEQVGVITKLANST